MKYICRGCKNEGPCILEIENDAERPVTCPWRGNLFLEKDEPDAADWEKLEESNYFELRGFGKTAKPEVKKMSETFLAPGLDCCGVGTDRNWCVDNCDDCAESGQHYRKNSVVSNREKEIDEIVSAHWNYVAEVIMSGADTSRQFSFDEVMKLREWDYTSAARHFYGHGFEDGQGAMAKKTLDRLKGT